MGPSVAAALWHTASGHALALDVCGIDALLVRAHSPSFKRCPTLVNAPTYLAQVPTAALCCSSSMRRANTRLSTAAHAAGSLLPQESRGRRRTDRPSRAAAKCRCRVATCRCLHFFALALQSRVTACCRGKGLGQCCARGPLQRFLHSSNCNHAPTCRT